MKHIKKRFLLETNSDILEPERNNYTVLEIKKDFNHSQLENTKNSIVYIVTDQEKAFGGFVHKMQGKNYVFPVPDPTLIYFHNAQISIKNIAQFKSTLLDKLDFSKKVGEPAINEMYNFYGQTCGFIIFLFTSIESFINQNIPDNYTFKKVSQKKTEIYNKAQIQEHLDFNTKLKEVLSDATGKNFFIKQTPSNQLIHNLKNLRDEIIHTKQAADNPLRYDKLIKSLLTFDYTKTLESVATFMNFYTPNYIVECNCGVDY
jgi:hypothetical protein